MLLNKIIIIGILLINIGNCYAWDDETGLTGNEEYEIIWSDEYNVFEYKQINNPSIYQKSITTLKKIWFKIKGYFITDVNLDINYDIDKYSWNGNNYLQTDGAEFSTGISHNANQTKTTVSTFDPVEEYFKGNDTRVEDWEGDIDHPDVLNISVSIEGGGETLDDTNYGYVTLSDTEAKKLGGGDIDYGFGDGKGSEGGSSGIYEGISLYDSTEGKVIDSSILSTVFFVLIPLIFIFSVMKLIMKVS